MKQRKKRISERASNLELRRFKAGRMFEGGKHLQADIARKLSVSPAAVCKWHAAWDADQEKGLRSKGQPGFASAFTEKKKKQLKAIILAGPAKLGYATDFWTVDRIRSAAKKKLRLDFSGTHIWKTVLSLGFSVQKPERRARERNEKAIQEWKLKKFPKLKKMGS